MQYIEPGSTSQSLVMYLQDSVTGGAYVTEDQTDWTFSYIQEGEASATADATISAGTLGTWADGTSKPFGTTGLWQIDFANAAFAVGVKYVQLLVTHDNGDFLPKSVMIDLSVRQADAVEISGDSTSADNLELQYDTTGLSGDTFPATQGALGNLTSGSAAISTTCEDAPDGFVITTGTNEGNDEDSTHQLNDVSHTLEDVGNTTDCYYIFDVGGNGVPVGITWNGYVNSQGDTYKFYAWNWTGTPAWEQVGSLNAVNGSTIVTETFDLTTSHVGTGANIGLVHFRIYSTDGTKVGTDRVLCSYAVVAQSVGYSGGAIWVDTVNGTAGTTPYVHGTADKPVLTWADALTLSGPSYVGLEKFNIANGSTITLTGNSDNYTFVGHEWTLVLDSQSIAGAHIEDACVSGMSSGSGAHFEHCEIDTGSYAESVFVNCGFAGGSTISMLSASTYEFSQCYTKGPSPAPIFNFGGAVGSTTAIFAYWAGGLQIANLGLTGTDKCNLHGSGKLTIAASCDGGTLGMHGFWTILDNVVGGFAGTTNEEARYEVSQLTGGEYPLDTDANGRVRVVDGTGAGELSLASGVIESDMTFIHGTALTETSGQLAGSFVKFFNKTTPTGTINSIPDAVAGATGGLFIAGTNAATAITTALTANITGNLSGSVGSVTGAVGSVTGAVGSVSGAVGSVTGAVGSVTGAVGSVAGNVDGNVSGSTGSIGTGGITAASIADAAIDNATFAADVHSTAYASNLLAQAVGTALIHHNLDHWMLTAVASNADMTTEVPDGTVLSNLMSKTSDTSTFVVSTDSLEGIAGAIVTNAPTYTVEEENYAVEGSGS